MELAPSWQNNSKEIIRRLKEKFKEKPSRGLEEKLKTLGIGVIWSTEFGEDSPSPEGFFDIIRENQETLSDEELAQYL